MSTLTESRTAIADALVAQGIRVAETGQISAPCVLLEPGDPWSSTSSLGHTRIARWRLTAIAGSVDTLAAYDELAELVDDVDLALRRVDGAQLPTWARPSELELAGVRRAVTIGTIQYASA